MKILLFVHHLPTVCTFKEKENHRFCNTIWLTRRPSKGANIQLEGSTSRGVATEISTIHLRNTRWDPIFDNQQSISIFFQSCSITIILYLLRSSFSFGRSNRRRRNKGNGYGKPTNPCVLSTTNSKTFWGTSGLLGGSSLWIDNDEIEEVDQGIFFRVHWKSVWSK